MRFSSVAKRFHGLDAFFKVFLCIVLAVSLCPPFVGAFADADEAEVLEPQATDTQLDESALEQGDLEVYADEAEESTAEVDAQADETADTPDADAGDVAEGDEPAADEPATVDEPTAVADPAEAVDDEPSVADDPASETSDPEEAAQEADEESDSEGSSSSAAADETLTFEDDTLVAIVSAPAGVLPAGATLEVEEIHPVDYASAEAYAEALTSLSQELRKDDKTYTAATVYDIRIMDPDGDEVEPKGNVDVVLDYKNARPIGAKSDPVEIAHITDKGALDVVDAEVETNARGAVENAVFSTDSFSYYIVFSTGDSAGSESEPSQVGNEGWVKFSTPADTVKYDDAGKEVSRTKNYGHYANASELPSLGTNDAYHRILQVNLWKLKNGVSAADEKNYDSDHYDKAAQAQYYWTWENQVTIDDFDLPNLEVLQTKMHTAWDDESKTIPRDSLIGTYDVRGYSSSDETDKRLNVLDVYVKDEDLPDKDSMRYIIRYIHADGSITDGNVRFIKNGGSSVTFKASDFQRPGEVYSGLSIVTGVKAIDAKKTEGTGTISYKDDVDIAKVYIYYKEDATQDSTTTSKDRYDKNGRDEYYTGGDGLFNNKKASVVSGTDRQFVLDLEAWYVKEAASVGMVLDASGSMAWTAGEPQMMKLTAQQLASIEQKLGPTYESDQNASHFLDPDDVDRLLVNTRVDSTAMGYNGYHYYIYDPRDTVLEFVALGYVDSDCGSVNSNYAQLSSGEKVVANRWASNESEYQGWYYVNSSSNNINPTGKSYDGLNGGGHVLFYIKNGNELWCRFFTSSSAKQGEGAQYGSVKSGYSDSPVFEKRDKMFTKNETLQDSIAQFGSILLGASPNSQISMTRFSTSNLTKTNYDYLPLLNWTSSTVNVAGALDQTKNSTMYKSRDNSVAGRDDGGTSVTTYEYGLTGQTHTATGVNAFINKLENKNGAVADNEKYLIIFTDGKDNSSTNDSTDTGRWGATGTAVNALKQDGYKVITVLMESLAMETNGEYPTASAFLKGLAESDENGNKLYFEAKSDSAHDMVERFREIAEYIGSGLQDYSVRDYIDPRFDVVNEAGDILTKLDSSGNFTDGVDATTHLRGFTTPDGKQAQLGYDPDKKMFFVLWQNQTIPATTKNSDKVNVWSSQVRVQAKEDFLGGNDILSNGNNAEMNSVYKPVGTKQKVDKNDPNSKYIFVPTTDSYGRETIDKSDLKNHPMKDFPYTSVNPGLLDVVLGNYEDTIFLGENITPGELFSSKMSDVFTKETESRDSHRVADTAYNTSVTSSLGDTDGSSVWFVEYLERAGLKLHENKDFYAKVFQHIDLTNLNTLLTALDGNRNYDVKNEGSKVTFTGKEIAAGEVIVIDKTSAEVKITLPYYYLAEPENLASYAGDPDAHGIDKVGAIEYTWRLHEFANNVAKTDEHGNGDENKFVEFDTYVDRVNHMDVDKSVQYQLSISYKPDAIVEGTGDDGTPRTKALTGKTGETDASKLLIRNPVGTEQTADVKTTDKMGWAVIHAVDGRILLEKKMLKTDWEEAKAKLSNPKMTFALTGDDITSEPDDEVVWSETIALPANAVREEGNYVYLLSEWVTGLPIGEYTLSETPEGGLKLNQIAGIDKVVFYPDNDNPKDAAEPYNATSTNWATNHDLPGATVTRKIGSEPKVTAPNYEPTTFTYAKVKEDLSTTTPKNYDPTQDKAYLNAQIGRAEVLNELQKTSIEVVKAWQPSAPSSPIVVKLSGSDDSVRYAELNSGNSWKYTFEQLPIDNTIYTVQEGTGVVGDDGTTCANWSAFGEKFTFANKKYQRVSTTYAGADNNASDAGIIGNVAEKAGTATITNQELTKVAVTKVWENLTPSADAKFAIQLNSTGEAARYAQLTAANDWTYIFEDLPVAANRTYRIVEGEGTVADDGTCVDFAAFTPDSDGFFTFDGKKYKQESLAYTPAGGTAGTDPLACVSPDSGTATVTNAAYTWVDVVKQWDSSVDPGSESIVAQITDGADYTAYASLSKANPSHRFGPFKVVEDRTFTVSEGTATVNGNEYTNFSAFGDTFVINGQTMAQQSLLYYTDEAAQTKAGSDTLSGSLSPYGGKAIITNGPAGADVKLKKTDSADDNTITGAKFTLKKGGTFAAATDVALASDTTNAAGEIALGKLVPGTYWLVETDVPAGYTKRPADKPIKVTVVNTSVTIQDEYTPAATLGEPDDDGVYTITVPNLRAYSLPAAGGSAFSSSCSWALSS